MRKFFLLLLLIFVLSCKTAQKGEEISPPSPKLFLKHIPIEKEGLWRENLKIIDIDGDGNLDIIAPPSRSGDVPVFFLGDGKGNFKEWQDLIFPNLSYSYGGIDALDFNKDGLMDILLANHGGRIFLLLQRSKGKFESLSDGFPDSVKFVSRAAKFIDWEGDGTYEVVALSENPYLFDKKTLSMERQKVFKLKDGIWEEVFINYSKENPSYCFGDSLTLLDFNSDGRMDFATACNSFGQKRVLFENHEEGFSPKDLEALPNSSYFFYVATSDFNKDGKDDLVFCAYTFDRSEEAKENPEKAMVASLILALKGENSWEVKEIAKHYSGKDSLQFRGVAAGDLNGDGWDDVVSILDNGEPYILINKRGVDFEKVNPIGFIKRQKASWVGIEDLDKDGKRDLVIAYGFEEEIAKIDVYLNEIFELYER